MRRMIGDFLVKYPKINIVEHVTDFLCSMRLTFVRPFRCQGRGSRPSTEQDHFMISYVSYPRISRRRRDRYVATNTWH
jgi:hypothetical protein